MIRGTATVLLYHDDTKVEDRLYQNNETLLFYETYNL